MAILETIDRDQHETKDSPLGFHKRGLSQTASGYGRKLTTPTMIKYKDRWRRIYCCIYSNSGTCYITAGKDWIVVR